MWNGYHTYSNKHLFDYTNQMNSIDSLHMFTVFLLIVRYTIIRKNLRALYLKPSTVMHLLSVAATVVTFVKYKGYIFAFTEVTIIFIVVKIIGVALPSSMSKTLKIYD
jgi:hypothetical protein